MGIFKEVVLCLILKLQNAIKFIASVFVYDFLNH